MKTAKLLLSTVFVLGFSNVTSAHNYLGTLGTSSSAKDQWYFQCLNPNTKKITFQINKTAGSPCVKVTYSSGLNASSCGSWSPTITIATGAGAKFFNITHSTSGINSYNVNAHCYDKAGLHNPGDQTTPQVYIKNQ